MDESQENLRDTLGEIERLIASARDKDVEVQPWIAQLAIELKASLPDPAEAGAPLARRMRSNPRKSLGAQAHLAASALNALRG